MHRRHYLTLAVGSSLTTLAGCAESDTSGTQTPEQVTDVSVSGKGYSPSRAVNTITLQYATDTVHEIRPPDAISSEPDRGNKFVVLHAEVQVQSDREENIDVYGSVIALEAGGVLDIGRSIRNLPELTQTVSPGASYEAWQRYEIPEESTTATLTTDKADAWFRNPTRIRFEKDNDLSVTIPED